MQNCSPKMSIARLGRVSVKVEVYCTYMYSTPYSVLYPRIDRPSDRGMYARIVSTRLVSPGEYG
jgi:hypothetical protein